MQECSLEVILKISPLGLKKPQQYKLACKAGIRKVKMSLESDKALGFFKETLIRKTRQAALKAR